MAVDRIPGGPVSPDHPLAALGEAIGDAVDKIKDDGTGGDECRGMDVWHWIESKKLTCHSEQSEESC